MKLTFEPYDDSGAPRLFVGLFRPPFESLTPDELRSLIPAGMYAIREGYERERWLAGALDRPLYAETVELQDVQR